MATYEELHTMFDAEEELQNKVQVATVEAARIIGAGEDTSDPPWDQTAGAHDDRVRWAGQVVSNTGSAAAQMLKLVLVENKGLTPAQIRGASDTAIQNNINSMVDVLAKALGL